MSFSSLLEEEEGRLFEEDSQWSLDSSCSNVASPLALPSHLPLDHNVKQHNSHVPLELPNPNQFYTHAMNNRAKAGFYMQGYNQNMGYNANQLQYSTLPRRHLPIQLDECYNTATLPKAGYTLSHQPYMYHGDALPPSVEPAEKASKNRKRVNKRREPRKKVQISFPSF